MSNRLKELRQAHKLTQTQLANKLNVAQNTLSYWESGKCDIGNDALLRFSEIFNVSIDYILGRADEVSTVPANASDDETLMFALWGNDNKDITPEMLADVRKFAQFIRETKKDEANDNN